MIQQPDEHGIRGTFLVDLDTGQQATKRFSSAYKLFKSDEYRELRDKGHNIDLTS